MKLSGLKINRKIVIGSIVVILIVSLGGIKVIHDRKIKAASKKGAITQKAVPSEVVTGSGTIKSSNKFEVTPAVNGKVKKVYFKEGDKVKTKDLMFEIDSAGAQANVNKLVNAVEQAKLEQNNNLVQIGKLTLKAPISGQISNILVKKGDIILKGTPVVTIADRAKLKLTVPFNSEQTKNITIGLKATVYLNATSQAVTGIVSYINPNSHSTDQSGKLFNVEILIDNPGAIKDGQKATAEINGASGPISSPENGLLSYASSQVLQCDSDGKVSSIDLKEDQFINAGTILMTLRNEAIVAVRDASELKIKDLQVQLDYAKKQLEDYKIYSLMDGTITKQDIKVGETPKSGEPISYLSDLAHMELVVSIDDIDITKIKLGQKASVVIDALPITSTKPLELVVTKISVEGTTVNGTTTYPVTFAIDNVAQVKSGMNANIEIKINK
ncbi:HlyD family efflux transporter periplasmic adaptor subunit [Clostridium sp. CF012]|uniref:efflux RND transporter periplasmic adaptor subunit n=1 Tax=Clostridium sp. CF012 TaxID=2843319 RepID=UPI001C0E68EA|nr:HlyD family efflux transporter periplasmic adaptor subunit [Clostridium sp. CF012]MBU3143450.1 HlyD family efflux transporter periplasmic adaptor subunit [Clostridium sp. CF012]